MEKKILNKVEIKRIALITTIATFFTAMANAQQPGGFGGFQVQQELETSKEWKNLSKFISKLPRTEGIQMS